MRPAFPAQDRLATLLESRRDLWRGRCRQNHETLATGHPGLDRLLPGGGWPCGRIVELLPQRFGTGELGLLLPLMAEQTRRQRPVVIVAPPLVPGPQALAAAGLDLAWLVVVRHHGHALWAAEQCLKSGLCGAVLVWPPDRIQPRMLRRLQLAAENGPAPVFVHYRHNQPPPASLATLRLAMRPGPVLEVLRTPGGAGGGTLPLEPGRVVPFQSSRPGNRLSQPASRNPLRAETSGP